MSDGTLKSAIIISTIVLLLILGFFTHHVDRWSPTETTEALDPQWVDEQVDNYFGSYEIFILPELEFITVFVNGNEEVEIGIESFFTEFEFLLDTSIMEIYDYNDIKIIVHGAPDPIVVETTRYNDSWRYSASTGYSTTNKRAFVKALSKDVMYLWQHVNKTDYGY